MGPAPMCFLLDSTGYTLMWNEREKPARYDWHEGTCISPPAGTWHQHYNTGNQPCKFVALHANTAVQKEEKGIEQIEFEGRGRFDAQDVRGGMREERRQGGYGMTGNAPGVTKESVFNLCG